MAEDWLRLQLGVLQYIYTGIFAQSPARILAGFSTSIGQEV